METGTGTGTGTEHIPNGWFELMAEEVGRVLVGKQAELETVLIAIVAGGHILLEDMPGVGKTLLAKTIAAAAGCTVRRIQFTPDMLPSDVTGVSVYRQDSGTFEFKPGPIAANLVIADELNRASARTQSALLEAMEERQYTVDGVTHSLPKPFLVIAAQNPAGHEGVYPLPEAQLDRFMVRLQLGYPSAEEECELLSRASGREQHAAGAVRKVVTAEQLVELQRRARAVHVEDSLLQYMVRLVQQTRAARELEHGASPRASIALLQAARSRALLKGRRYVLPDDVKAMYIPVLAHRVRLRSELVYNGVAADAVLARMLEQTPVPRLSSASGGRVSS